ncbi:MAG: hypothetical protein JWQ27_2425 [Ferruginibacter sp.]|nr:hypothetical protein [Ferruginibacter sp.]
MRLKHFEYIKLVKEEYRRKRSGNLLSPLLAQPTPGNIRRECANVYQERLENRDEPALRVFFGPAEPGRKFLAVIQRFDVNKFKPLNNFLKENGSHQLSDRNLELLAWLIDFRHRPYRSDNQVLLSDEELILLEKTGDVIIGGTGSDELPGNPTKHGGKEDDIKRGGRISLLKSWWSSSAIKYGLLLSIITAFSGFVFKILGDKKPPQNLINTSIPACMYWADDHYTQTPCNPPRQGTILLPLDEDKVKNFRRITLPDTITVSSIGKIYYIKDGGSIYYFTSGGTYPKDVNRSLKVLSRYMFEKYLGQNKVTVP